MLQCAYHVLLDRCCLRVAVEVYVSVAFSGARGYCCSSALGRARGRILERWTNVSTSMHAVPRYRAIVRDSRGDAEKVAGHFAEAGKSK